MRKPKTEKFHQVSRMSNFFAPLGKTCQSIYDTRIKHIYISEMLKCEKHKVSYKKIFNFHKITNLLRSQVRLNTDSLVLVLIYVCCGHLVTKLCLTLLGPHGLQSIRLHCPCDFPGKNTGVGCHFCLQIMPIK